MSDKLDKLRQERDKAERHLRKAANDEKALAHVDTSRYDSTTYPPLEKVPPRYAIVRRNEWMVRESDVVISGVTHGWGGAAKTLDYARHRQKVIFQFPNQTKKE